MNHVIAFALSVAYALWLGRRRTFRHAARIYAVTFLVALCTLAALMLDRGIPVAWHTWGSIGLYASWLFWDVATWEPKR